MFMFTQAQFVCESRMGTTGPRWLSDDRKPWRCDLLLVVISPTPSLRGCYFWVSWKSVCSPAVHKVFFLVCDVF